MLKNLAPITFRHAIDNDISAGQEFNSNRFEKRDAMVNAFTGRYG